MREARVAEKNFGDYSGPSTHPLNPLFIPCPPLLGRRFLVVGLLPGPSSLHHRGKSSRFGT